MRSGVGLKELAPDGALGLAVDCFLLDGVGVLGGSAAVAFLGEVPGAGDGAGLGVGGFDSPTCFFFFFTLAFAPASTSFKVFSNRLALKR